MYRDVNGIRLYCERRGIGEPLLWISGFTVSAAIFDPVLPLYEDRFENILYDNRGSGRSSSPMRPTSMQELAADAAGLLDRLGIDSAHVFGISMGGMVAQELALRFPQRVRGLILGATTPGGPLATLPNLRELAALGTAMAAGARGPGRPWLAAALFSPRFRSEQPEQAARLLEHFRRHRSRPHGVAGHWWASVYHDTVSRLPAIQAPTLVVHGSEDAMAPVANARLLADRIPGAELRLIDGAGHAFLLERPEESFAAIAGWLERHGEIPPGQPPGARSTRWERVSRPLGLPIAAVRTGASLAQRAGLKPRARGEDDVAVDRRAASPA